MRSVVLGGTGLEVTRVGLGLAAAGRPGYIDLGRGEDLGADRSVEAMERRTHDLLDAAYAAGIRYVDAARSYGRAEAFLASWLAARGDGASDVVVGSKWGYRYVGSWRVDAEVHEVKDHSAGALERQLAESRELLGNRLALYQIHSATMETGVLRDHAVLARLSSIRAEGVAVGLTVSGPGQARTIRAALEVEVDGEIPFGSVQATWNALERSAGPALAEAHDAGLGVLVKEAMANGRLVRDPDERARPIRDLSERLGSPVDAVAMAFVLAQPWCDVVLSGAVTRAQVLSNASAAGLDLAGEDLGRLDGMVETPEAYWSTRSSLPWA
jgi:aryl-alcohol dehydrogenase-like predicted oxidoreductase